MKKPPLQATLSSIGSSILEDFQDIRTHWNVPETENVSFFHFS